MFSGVYSNFNSFIADEYKRGLVQTLLFCIFSIVSNFELFHVEVVKLKDNLHTYIGRSDQKSLILHKISKCHLPKQHFKNFLPLAKPEELKAQINSNDRAQWRRRMFGQESITFTLEKDPMQKKPLIPLIV